MLVLNIYSGYGVYVRVEGNHARIFCLVTIEAAGFASQVEQVNWVSLRILPHNDTKHKRRSIYMYEYREFIC